MLKYIASRLGQSLVSLWLIATAVFLLVRLTGDPLNALIPDYAPPSLREQVSASLGLNEPVLTQYWIFIRRLLSFDLGTSFTGRPVSAIIGEHILATASLAFFAVLLAVAVGIPLGIISALRHGTIIDTAARGVATIGQSVPPFWLGLMLILLFSVLLHWLPVEGLRGWTSYVLPATTLALPALAGITRLTRSSMFDVLSSDYIRMAHAKGVANHVVILKHALRNALIPVVTYTGLLLGGYLNGSVVIENVFAWPGVGYVALNSVILRDYPMVQGIVILFATCFIAVNLLVDILYSVIDPRIRKS